PSPAESTWGSVGYGIAAAVIPPSLVNRARSSSLVQVACHAPQGAGGAGGPRPTKNPPPPPVPPHAGARSGPFAPNSVSGLPADHAPRLLAALGTRTGMFTSVA